jgi:hypothetical protein
MTTTHATAVAPPKLPAARGAFTEQLHVMVDQQTREYVLGVADAVAREAGYKFLRQGEIIRELLAEAIAARYERDPEAYEAAVRAGRLVAAVPADGAAPRRA